MDEYSALRGMLDQIVRIKVVGVGGGGCNAVDRMIDAGVQDVEFIAVNTDAQALQHSSAEVQIQIGARLTRGLGSGGNPIVGQRSAEETHADVATYLKGADMIFVTAGMGGGTGTGAAPIIAGQAHDTGALTVGVVTLPFAFEGKHRRTLAEQGIEQLRPMVDTLIIIPNDNLIQAVTRHTTMKEAFHLTDQVLLHGIRGISDLITRRGMINVDFADVRAIMAGAGTAWMAIGAGSGPKRMLDAVTQALSSPLLDVDISGARGVLCNIIGGEDLSLTEVSDAVDMVYRAVDPEVNLIHGVVIDPTLNSGEVMITLIATGFDQNKPNVQRKVQRPTEVPAPQDEPPAPPEPATPPAPPVAAETPARRPAAPPVPQPRPLSLSAHATRHQDGNDLDIPPFLRRRAERKQQPAEAKDH